MLSTSFYTNAADPVTLNITGNIVASPCQINGDSINKSVDLGQNIQASDLKTAGSSSNWVKFNLNIGSCPVGTTKVTMTMHGTPDSPGVLDLYQNTGTASNVAVQLQMETGEVMGDGQSYTGTIYNNAYSFKMQARAYTSNGNVTPGTISTVVTATFTYQ
ncbi:TPA: type 1 fimbrial protein [Klebsiella aerogenes]|nr:type 1 fimbrial protein [Klebsiella sp. HSTU-Sny5]HEC0404215.1 type 1 fimbrial protein [Klebsiella aerogenes]HEC1359289.1 type 1 fimbrial protein [Klebsiella aerogenes]